jgi:hypothetical protein
MEIEGLTPCEYAQNRHATIARFRFLWSLLILIFGTGVVVFLTVAVVFLLRSDWLPGALTTLGTIVQGAAITFVVGQRREAVKEEEKAFRDVRKWCTPAQVQNTDSMVHKLKLFGTFR